MQGWPRGYPARMRPDKRGAASLHQRRLASHALAIQSLPRTAGGSSANALSLAASATGSQACVACGLLRAQVPLTSRACWQSHENRSSEDSMKDKGARPSSKAAARPNQSAMADRARASPPSARRRCGAIASSWQLKWPGTGWQSWPGHGRGSISRRLGARPQHAPFERRSASPTSQQP